MSSLNPTRPAQASAASADLLAAARAGDTEAFGELCRDYETRLLRQAAALRGDELLAEELAQETLVEAWKCLARYSGRCQFFTWLCAILLNRYRNSIRARRPLPFSTFPEQAQHELENRAAPWLGQEPLPSETAELHEEAVLVRQCIDALPPKHQQVIYLRFYVEDSLEGIAAALGCSIGTVKSRLFHALEKLRAMNAFAQLRPERGHACPQQRGTVQEEDRTCAQPQVEPAADRNIRAPRGAATSNAGTL